MHTLISVLLVFFVFMFIGLKLWHLGTHLKQVYQGRTPLFMPRSGHWPVLRREHLLRHSRCEVCGGQKKLNVHHISPFHDCPGLELDPKNLITLCESGANGINCHLAVGHLGNFKSFNVNVREDAALWNQKIASRPK